MSKSKYKLPEDLEPYRHLVNSTDGFSIEDLMNQDVSVPGFLYSPMAMRCHAVSSQISLLKELKDSERLK